MLHRGKVLPHLLGHAGDSTTAATAGERLGEVSGCRYGRLDGRAVHAVEVGKGEFFGSSFLHWVLDDIGSGFHGDQVGGESGGNGGQVGDGCRHVGGVCRELGGHLGHVGDDPAGCVHGGTVIGGLELGRGVGELGGDGGCFRGHGVPRLPGLGGLAGVGAGELGDDIGERGVRGDGGCGEAEVAESAVGSGCGQVLDGVDRPTQVTVGERLREAQFVVFEKVMVAL